MSTPAVHITRDPDADTMLGLCQKAHEPADEYDTEWWQRDD